MKRKTKKKLRFWITLFVGVTFAYFIWLTWKKLTEWMGSSTTIWIITGSIVIIAMLTGFWSWNKVTKKFIQ
jgi:hypothetical protein